VLECGGGMAQEVITTIGQAFELRFKEYLKRRPQPLNLQHQQQQPQPPSRGATMAGPDVEYYNDMPGKQPPQLQQQQQSRSKKGEIEPLYSTQFNKPLLYRVVK